MTDVLVIGGGIIGLAVAWVAGERGHDVQVVDAGEAGAWHVAAGMLAPVTEADHGDDALVRLGLESAARYDTFAAGLGVPLREQGTLVVARDRDEAEALDRLHAYRTALGLEAERLRPTAARRREPALAPTVRLALDVPQDRSVDPRALVAALRERLPVRTGRAIRLLDDGGVELEDGTELRAEHVVLATGAHALDGALPVRPVKGQVLRLRDPNGPGLVTRTIRTNDAYLGPARRRPLRPRRHDGGARLGRRGHRRRGVRAPAGHVRGRSRRAGARDRGGAHRLPSRHAGQRAGDRPRHHARRRVGDRPLAQRRPARTGHGRPGGDDAGGRAAAELGRVLRPTALRRSRRMNVTVNGRPADLPEDATVATLVGELALPAAGRGVAVAVDREVVPRGAWETTALVEGAKVEVVHAVQGG